MVAVAVTEIRNCTVMDGDDHMSNAQHIYSIANDHAQTVQVCIDRLHELGANEQLKLLTGRLQKLAVRATDRETMTRALKAAQRGTGPPRVRHRRAPPSWHKLPVALILSPAPAGLSL
jgi:hypothetical protein